MLAQLEQRADVAAAEVDRRGELLRINLRPPGTLDDIREALERMGFAAEETRDDVGGRWYGVSDVRELSREEGRVIAYRAKVNVSFKYEEGS